MDLTCTKTLPRYRQELLSLLADHRLTHWVTLNTNADCSTQLAIRLLRRWRVEVLRRLHGYRFFQVPCEARMRYVGTMEQTQAGYPHFHLLVQVPVDRTDRFLRVAPERWSRISSRASSWIVPIEEQPDAVSRLVGYATKNLSLSAQYPFFHSEVDR